MPLSGDLKLLGAHISGGNLVLLKEHHGVAALVDIEELAVGDGLEALHAVGAVEVARALLPDPAVNLRADGGVGDLPIAGAQYVLEGLR